MINFYKDKQQILNWLDKYQVKNYKLIPDEKYGFIVDVDDDVNLQNNNLNFIPVKFNHINGDLLCDNNKLTSLEFSPKTVVVIFSCGENQLTSLEFCPQTVGDSFVVDVDDNVYLEIKNLIFIPFKFNKFSGNFHCSNNQLTSLEHCPKEINLDFFCNNNKLISLKYCPEVVSGYFFCNNNQLESLESLEFCPQSVLGYFYCDNNPKLKEIQKITNFNLIYLEHKKLDNQLLSDNTKKSTKIKI